MVKQSKRRIISSIFSKRDFSVRKCAMNCERMSKVLVRFCNMIMKHDHFPSRWLDVLDAMIEKGKRNKMNKLRATQTIKAYLQLIMRTFLGLRIAENYEHDDRTSKHNYGSRKGCSIDSASLEKRLIFDLARKNRGTKYMHYV